MSDHNCTEADFLHLVDNYDIARSDLAMRHDNGMDFFGFGYIERMLVMRYGNIQAADKHSNAIRQIRCQVREEMNNDTLFYSQVSKEVTVSGVAHMDEVMSLTLLNYFCFYEPPPPKVSRNIFGFIP